MDSAERGSKRRRGRPGITSSTRKKRKSEAQKLYQLCNKRVTMDEDVHNRWTVLAEQHGVSLKELAGMLVSAAEAGGSLSLSSAGPATATSRDTAPSMEGTPSAPHSSPDMRPSTSQSGPQLMSTPVGPLNPSQPVYDSSSDARSAISGIENIGGTPRVMSSDDSANISEGSDNKYDVSVTYKVQGDYVYLEDLAFDDDADDEDYLVEAELALINRGTEGLPIVTAGDEVYHLNDEEDPPAEEEELVAEEEEPQPQMTRSGLHEKVDQPDEAAAARYFLVEEAVLRRLASTHRKVCCKCGATSLQVAVNRSGTAGHIHWTCPAGHISSLCTQRTVNRVHSGDIKVAAGIVLSGNNFAKIQLMASHAGMGMVNKSTFNRLQNKYVATAVEEHANQMMAANVQKHAANPDGVVIMGDGRNDSPGHTAQFLTYLLMEVSTGDVMHAVFKDKRQTGGSSYKMEPVAYFEGLNTLQEKGLKIKEVVTDAHSEITAKMRTKHPDIKHSHDTWHGGKNLGKRLTKNCAKAANRPLVPWVKDVVNHWWFCAETCEGNATLFKEKWRGVLHHVVNEHTWGCGGGVGPGQCEHKELDQDKTYLEKGSPAHQALTEVVMDKTLLKKVPYYVNFRHTGELESVNNHILMYCSKRFSFRYPGYKCRNYLALIDYQHHKDRELLRNPDGTVKYGAKWSKRANDYVPYKCRVAKTYEYIPGLIKEIMRLRLCDTTPLSQLLAPQDDDPRHVAPRLAPHSPPPIEEILRRRHLRRFGSEDQQ